MQQWFVFFSRHLGLISVLCTQTTNAMTLMFVWLMAKHLMMEKCRCVGMGNGVQCAMTDGILEMQKWCADNWAILDVRLNVSVFNCTYVLFICYSFLASYPLLSRGSHNYPLYSFYNVNCTGTESMLSDCSHRGIYDCYVGEAGVICSSMLCRQMLGCSSS